MKKMILFLLLVSLFLACGCGSNDTVTDYKSMTERERIIHLHENYYLPLKKNYYDLISEYRNASKTSKTIEEFHQATIPLWKKKYKPYMIELRNTLPSVESKEMQAIYPYFSSLKSRLFVDAFELLAEMEERAEYQKDLKGDINDYPTDINEFIIDSFEENDLIYQNEYSKAIYGKKTFELNYTNYEKLNKGMTLREIIHIFKMPPTISVYTNTDDTECYYWVLGADDSNIKFVNELKPSDKYVKLIFKEDPISCDLKMIEKKNVGIK